MFAERPTPTARSTPCGIRLQVIDHHTGFLVNTPEGAALRLRYLLHQTEKMAEMGAKGRSFVRENFLSPGTYGNS